MDQFMRKENIIEISEEKELDVKINGQQIVIESNKDSSLFFSPLSFCDATSPTDLACAIIDEQLALDEPDIQINDTKPKLDIRRNLAELPDNDRDKFRDAVFLLKERGEYDKYIKFHGFTNNLGHFGPAFFAWHRVFLRKFELELQQLDQQYEDVTLPYWDYTSPNVDDHGNSKNWRDDFLGANGVVSLKWTGKDGSEKKWILPDYQTENTLMPMSSEITEDWKGFFVPIRGFLCTFAPGKWGSSRETRRFTSRNRNYRRARGVRGRRVGAHRRTPAGGGGPPRPVTRRRAAPQRNPTINMIKTRNIQNYPR